MDRERALPQRPAVSGLVNRLLALGGREPHLDLTRHVPPSEPSWLDRARRAAGS